MSCNTSHVGQQDPDRHVDATPKDFTRARHFVDLFQSTTVSLRLFQLFTLQNKSGEWRDMVSNDVMWKPHIPNQLGLGLGIWTWTFILYTVGNGGYSLCNGPLSHLAEAGAKSLPQKAGHKPWLTSGTHLLLGGQGHGYKEIAQRFPLLGVLILN